jgi:hypothetical protein
MIYGGVMKTIQPDTFEKLAKVVASKKDGFNVAIELLYMRVHLEKREGVKIPPEFQEVGWHVLESVCFSARDQRQDHRLAEIAKACLPGKNCAARVAELCKRLKQAVLSHQTSIVYYDDLLVELLRAEPRAALDALCQGDGGEAVKGLDIIGNALRVKNRLFDVIPQGVLLDWCDGDSVVRYPAMAGRITISTNEDAAGERDWTPLALRLLEKAPNPIEVLKRYTRQIRLSGGWGSPASITEANARLLDKLPPSSDSAMKAFIEDEKVRLAQDIEELRRHETARDRKRSERFE